MRGYIDIFRFDSDEQSGYYAEFVHKSLGFTVYGYNFDKDDFVRILLISGLIDGF